MLQSPREQGTYIWLLLSKLFEANFPAIFDVGLRLTKGVSESEH